MDKNLIEEIASDCGYGALGLYEYLYSIRDEKYNVTIISMSKIADIGAYHNVDPLVEDIENLKEWNYLLVVGNVYLFPRATDDYQNTLELLATMADIISDVKCQDDLLEVLKDNENLQTFISATYQAYKEDVEFGFSEEIIGQ